YFLAPVIYVGVLQAAICDSLGASHTVANLPESVFMWMMPVPVVIAWFWPAPALARPLLVGSYLMLGVAGGAAALLVATNSRSLIIPAITVHAGVVGVANGVINMCLWEMLGRGMSPARRAWTLGCTYGAGPIMAVLGSCASQLVLAGDFLGMIHTQPVPAP